jgi:hypothetical protein
MEVRMWCCLNISKMRLKKRFGFFLYLLVILTVSHAQSVSGVRPAQDGNKINIYYNIVGAKYNQSFDVSVYFSNDGGNTYAGPLQAVEGDVGEVLTGGSKMITWDVLYDEFDIAGDMVFDVRMDVIETPISTRFYVGLSGNTTAPLGLTFGQAGKMGWYVRASINTNVFTEAAYQTSDVALLDYDGDGYYTYNGNSTIGRMNVTAGLNLRLATDVLYLYLGAGYGQKSLLWQVGEFSYIDDSKVSEAWASHETATYSGAEAEAGLLLITGKLYMSIGATTLQGKRYDAAFSFGLAF